MTSPQKQDEQQESDQLHRATRQQDASQEGDAPRLDQTAEAAALGDNLDESQPRLAGHQDASRGSNVEPGNPLNTDQLEDATGTRPDRDAPRAAIIEAGEPMTEYSLEERGQSRLAEHQDAFRGSSIRTPSEGRCRAKSQTQWGDVEVTLTSTRSTTTAPWEYTCFKS